MSRQHELSSFAVGTVLCTALGEPTVGALILGVVCALAGDLPDICSPRARIVKMLCLVPYRVPALDKNGNQRRRKPKAIRVSARATGKTKGKARSKAARRVKRKLWWLSARRSVTRWLGKALFGISEPEGELIWVWRTFPGHQLHRLSVRASEAVYDRYATAADRRDVVPMVGPRFRAHRGLTHSVWAALVVGVLAWIVGETVGAIVGESVSPTFGSSVFGPVRLSVMVGAIVTVGMLTHIGGDACTDLGVSPFAPVLCWKGRRYPVMGLWEPLRFKAGQWVEDGPVKWVCTGLACLAIGNAFGVLDPLLGLLGQIWAGLS